MPSTNEGDNKTKPDSSQQSSATRQEAAEFSFLDFLMMCDTLRWDLSGGSVSVPPSASNPRGAQTQSTARDNGDSMLKGLVLGPGLSPYTFRPPSTTVPNVASTNEPTSSSPMTTAETAAKTGGGTTESGGFTDHRASGTEGDAAERSGAGPTL